MRSVRTPRWETGVEGKSRGWVRRPQWVGRRALILEGRIREVVWRPRDNGGRSSFKALDIIFRTLTFNLIKSHWMVWTGVMMWADLAFWRNMGAAFLRIVFTVHGAGWQLEGSLESEAKCLMVIREGALKSRQILGIFFLELSSHRRLEYLLLSTLADRVLTCLSRRAQLDWLFSLQRVFSSLGQCDNVAGSGRRGTWSHLVVELKHQEKMHNLYPNLYSFLSRIFLL